MEALYLKKKKGKVVSKMFSFPLGEISESQILQTAINEHHIKENQELVHYTPPVAFSELDINPRPKLMGPKVHITSSLKLVCMCVSIYIYIYI